MLKNFTKVLGPGILFASTAIGVSHLVQSTRAGADYGFSLLIFVILANLLKYPFFEYGSRYANCTETSIIDGYKKMGKWMLILYLLLTIGTMFFVTAAVAAVTGGFFENLFGLNSVFDFTLASTFITVFVCVIILLVGKFSVLDKLIKLIGIVLLVSTVFAFILVIIKGPIYKGSLFSDNMDLFGNSTESIASFAFLISLMGWMPTALDLSAWNSLWTLERIKESHYKPTLKETLFEFRFGYIISAVLALVFITLGAFLMFKTGATLSENSAQFSNEVVTLYTSIIGSWSYIIIAASAFSIMFSTCITVLDGYGRSFEKVTELLIPEIKSNKSYTYAIIIVALGACALIYYFIIFSQNPKGFKTLIDLATAISFIVAPIIAIANYYLVTNKNFKKEYQPKSLLKLLSIVGIIFLIGFSLIYLYSII